MAKCDGPNCGAEIIWALSEKGKRTPVDAAPTEEGNTLLIHRAVGEPPTAHIVRKDERAQMETERRYRVEHLGHPDEPLRLYVPHWSTCPDAKKFKRR